MNSQLRDKFYGWTIEERIAGVVFELEQDAVGLWQIVSFGRQGFDLSGDALRNYVRRHVLALLENGAKPVTAVANAVHGRGWLPLEYGRAPDRIADAIVTEWLAGGEDSDFRVWFALPGMCLKP